MTEPTDEMFAAAYDAFIGSCPPEAPAIEQGRAMLAALQAHGCIPQQQGLTKLQELTVRLYLGKPDLPLDTARANAVRILALGDAK